MVPDNHVLQREYRPAEPNGWFATAFVHGTPWVMPGNLIGMSQYADGGAVATKPYRCRLHQPHERPLLTVPVRPEAAHRRGRVPVHGGFWAWMHRKSDVLADNYRMKQPLSTMRRLGDLDSVVRQEQRRRF